MSNRLTSRILKELGIPHTKSFVQRLSSRNIQWKNLFGITRMLEVFGVKSKGIRVEDKKDLCGADTPIIGKLKESEEFIVITSIDEGGVEYSNGVEDKKMGLDEFSPTVEDIFVLLEKKDGACEPRYDEHRREETGQSLLWLVPAAYFVWAVVSRYVIGNPGSPAASDAFCLCGGLLGALGLFICILLHRQWTGDSNAVGKICSLFKTSKCSSAHDSFFFNKWFDLSEVGASYFLTILVLTIFVQDKASAAAWMILPALPASLWNLWYQFFKQKHWCPLCLAVQLLFWVIAAVFLALGGYSGNSFDLCGIISALLLWGTVLVLILKFVTPSVKYRHAKEQAEAEKSAIKGQDKVMEAFLGEARGEKGKRTRIEIAVSPTCPFCKRAEEIIDTVLVPTGRFDIEKKYMKIHEGDFEKIVDKVGEKKAEEDKEWCESHQIKGTPAIFVNGTALDKNYSLEDVLYL